MTDSFARSTRSAADARNWGLTRRAWFKASGFDDVDLARPVIGIAQTWSELNHCHIHFRELAEAVKRGVWQAGGWPVEFPTISLGEFNIAPTTMLYRNLMAMDVEEMIRAQPLDGVVLLASCDKNIPAMLMGAASANKPAILLTGGPMLASQWHGEVLGACTDCRRLTEDLRAGKISRRDYAEIEEALGRTTGHCMVMGTASTMAALGEALGMSLPGSACIPAPDTRRLRLAEAVGRRMVGLVNEKLTPSRILTPAAFDNAIRLLMALGGSTNAVVHLPAIAGRVGIELPLDRFDEMSRSTPLLTNVRPSGAYHLEDLFEAGGVPAVLMELAPLIDMSTLTVSGQTIGANLDAIVAGEDASKLPRHRTPLHTSENGPVIRTLADPLAPEGGTAILTGNLCPRGAVIKQSAASPQLLRHRGRAVVFKGQDDLEARIDSADLDVR
ncbi:MAG: dihydroxy-acid dehydratase, partial [Gemmataceae bacterium]